VDEDDGDGDRIGNENGNENGIGNGHREGDGEGMGTGNQNELLIKICAIYVPNLISMYPVSAAATYTRYRKSTLKG
jgi:hypothetical protein